MIALINMIYFELSSSVKDDFLQNFCSRKLRKNPYFQVIIPLNTVDLGQVLEEWRDISPPPDDKEAVKFEYANFYVNFWK